MPSGKLGVVLFQLGGPDSLEAVEPFLYNLFSDPDIIDFPFSRLTREPLARLMASRRAKHAAEHYRALGGATPLLENTLRQARALEADLRRDFEACVVVAMRYWRPFTQEAVAALERFAPERIVLLPLYPQYSRTTTGSSLNEWNRRFSPDGWRPQVRLIRDFHDFPPYIEAVAAHLGSALSEFADPAAVELVFSAHSVPVDVIERGDPYARQIERTVELVLRHGGWPNRHHVCYQSKVGPSRWLRPMLKETLEKLAAKGVQQVLVIPISFVSDHVETLYEIAIEHRHIASRLGIRDFRMMPGLNDSPRFIRALGELVRGAI